MSLVEEINGKHLKTLKNNNKNISVSYLNEKNRPSELRKQEPA